MEQIGQRVKNVKDSFAFPGDNAVHLGREGFEPIRHVQGVDVKIGALLEQRTMATETHINHTLLVGNRVDGKIGNQFAVRIDVIHLPDHIVAFAQMIDNAV